MPGRSAGDRRHTKVLLETPVGEEVYVRTKSVRRWVGQCLPQGRRLTSKTDYIPDMRVLLPDFPMPQTTEPF